MVEDDHEQVLAQGENHGRQAAQDLAQEEVPGRQAVQVLKQEENLGHQAAQDLAREEDSGIRALDATAVLVGDKVKMTAEVGADSAKKPTIVEVADVERVIETT
jgi:sRNA-binding protein